MQVHFHLHFHNHCILYWQNKCTIYKISQIDPQGYGVSMILLPFVFFSWTLLIPNKHFFVQFDCKIEVDLMLAIMQIKHVSELKMIKCWLNQKPKFTRGYFCFKDKISLRKGREGAVQLQHTCIYHVSKVKND